MKGVFNLLAVVVLLACLAVPVKASHNSCGVDIVNLDVQSNTVEAKVKNTGSMATKMVVKFFIDGRFELSRDKSLSAGESSTFTLDYKFSKGTTDVSVDADTDCGDMDRESITHVFLDHEIDNIDSEIDNLQPTEPQTCGVDLTWLTFTERTFVGQPVQSSVRVQNTGNDDEQMDLILYMDGVEKERLRQLVTAYSDLEHTFDMYPDMGNHRLTVVAQGQCGVADTVMQDFTVIPDRLGIIELSKMQAQSTDTAVTFHPTHLDVEAGSARSVKISITSKKPQNFLISQEGLQSDWASFESKVFVSGSKDVYMLISPKNLGQKEFNIIVKAETEGTTFAGKIELFGSAPVQKQASVFPGIDDFMLLMIALVALLAVLVLGAFAYVRRYDVHTEVSHQPTVVKQRPHKPGTPPNYPDIFRRIKDQIHDTQVVRQSAVKESKKQGDRDSKTSTLQKIKERIRQ